jgi:hypothetical protein
MGKITTWDPNGGSHKPEPNEIRCRYRAVVKFLVRNVDVISWEDYITEVMPNSYEGHVGPVHKDEPITTMRLAYEAASANANDITKRLRMSQLHHLPVSSERTRICGCPPGTTRCRKRTTE